MHAPRTSNSADPGSRVTDCIFTMISTVAPGSRGKPGKRWLKTKTMGQILLHMLCGADIFYFAYTNISSQNIPEIGLLVTTR